VYGPAFRVGASRGRRLEAPPALAAHAAAAFVATVHPSSVLRSRRRDEDFDGLVQDLRVAASLAQAR
jgi:DNA polymerase